MNVTIDEIVWSSEKTFKRKRIGEFFISEASKHLLDYSTLIIDHDITKPARTVRIQAIRSITIATTTGLAIGALVDVTDDKVNDAIDYPQKRIYKDWAQEKKVWEPTR